MTDALEGAHPPIRSQFGEPDRKRARRVNQVEGQRGAGLITEVFVHIPIGTSYYDNRADIPPVYPATGPIKRTYELNPGKRAKVLGTNLDERGEIIPETFGERGDYIPVIVGQTEAGEDIIKLVPFNDPKKKSPRYT